MNTKDYKRLLVLLIIIVSLAVTINCHDYERYGLSLTSAVWTRLSYHFIHASLLHWLINALVMMSIVFRIDLPFWQWAATFFIASIYPQHDTVPMVGASVWLYALLGVVTPIVRKPVRFFFETSSFILVGYFINQVADVTLAWTAHGYAYAAGMLLGLFTQPIYSKSK